MLITALRIAADILTTALSRNTRFDNILTFIVDQIFRVAVLSIVLLIPALDISRYLVSSFFSPIYNSGLFLVYLSFFLAVTYGGSFFIFYLKRTFVDLNMKFEPDYGGMAERLFIFTFLLLGEAWLIGIPAVIIIRWLFIFSGIRSTLFSISAPAIQFQKIRSKSSLGFDLLASPLFPIIMGIILKGT